MRRPRAPEATLAVLGVLLLVVSLAGFLGAGDGGSDPEATDGADAVAIVDFSFRPGTLTVPAGDTVTWTNEDGVEHTVTSTGDGPLASGDLPPQATYEATFDQPGTYDYFCSIHPSMRGTIEVSAP